eukprot:IDg15757t1
MPWSEFKEEDVQGAAPTNNTVSVSNLVEDLSQHGHRTTLVEAATLTDFGTIRTLLQSMLHITSLDNCTGTNWTMREYPKRAHCESGRNSYRERPFCCLTDSQKKVKRTYVGSLHGMKQFSSFRGRARKIKSKKSIALHKAEQKKSWTSTGDLTRYARNLGRVFTQNELINRF